MTALLNAITSWEVLFPVSMALIMLPFLFFPEERNDDIGCSAGCQPENRGVLVVGGGIGGIQAALDIAESGYYVYLVEQSPAIGGEGNYKI